MKIRITAIISLLAVFMSVLTGCNGTNKIVSDNYYLNEKYFYVDSDTPVSSDEDTVTSLDSSTQSGSSDSSTDNSSEDKTPIISTNLTNEQLAGNINNTTHGGMKSIKVETSVIYGFNKDWSFNHGAYINYFNGKFYAFWQHGRLHEDACGQHIAYATSTDGINWSEAKDFIPVKVDRYGNEMLSSPYGTYVANGKLIVYVMEFGYDPNELKNSADPTKPDNPDGAKKLGRKLYAMYTTDGKTWTAGNEVASGGGNRDPKLIPDLKMLFWAGFNSLAYTSDLTGMTNWVQSGPTLAQIQDAERRGGDKLFLTEAATYKSDDNVLHLLMRSNTQYLWATSSRDNGKTWGDIYRTNFTDDCQKFDFIYLPNGDILYIGTPGYTGYNFRMPLVAAVSKDGYTFDKQYIIGNEPYTPQATASTKLGNYSYPSAMIKGEYVYVIYAKQKEIIEVSRFKWADLK